jgi:cation diffusion facilitator family transporter
MLILGESGHSHDHGEHDHGGHDHPNDAAHDHAGQDHHEHEEHAHHGSDSDHNLKAAYLHVFADAMTSVLAIVALLAAKYFGWIWADPLMGIVGAIMVARWCIGLVTSSSKVLLDHQIPLDARKRIIGIVESYRDTKVTDFHLWCIGPGIFTANMSVATKYPDSPEKYKTMIPGNLGVVHATVEVHHVTD